MVGKRQDRNKWSHVPACPTLYVNNLNDKMPKNELKINLYYWFSQFGYVLEFVALKTNRMRGQAFIVFEDVKSCTRALNSSKNHLFFGNFLRNFQFKQIVLKITLIDFQPTQTVFCCFTQRLSLKFSRQNRCYFFGT